MNFLWFWNKIIRRRWVTTCMKKKKDMTICRVVKMCKVCGEPEITGVSDTWHHWLHSKITPSVFSPISISRWSSDINEVAKKEYEQKGIPVPFIRPLFLPDERGALLWSNFLNFPENNFKVFYLLCFEKLVINNIVKYK